MATCWREYSCTDAGSMRKSIKRCASSACSPSTGAVSSTSTPETSVVFAGSSVAGKAKLPTVNAGSKERICGTA